LENEPIGTPVMQVRAIDADGTEANNQVWIGEIVYLIFLMNIINSLALESNAHSDIQKTEIQMPPA
jgi:hypothetical protein